MHQENDSASEQQPTDHAPDHSASDFEPIPYRAWPIGYSLASQDADELPMRARKASAL